MYSVEVVYDEALVQPVKSKFLTALPAVTVNVAAAAPVKLNDIELDSDGVPGVIVLAVVVALVTFTAGIPYTEKLVTDVVFQTVPVDETLIEPLVPKFIAREFELFDRNVRAVKEKLFKFNVPEVRVTDEPVLVKASCNTHSPVPVNAMFPGIERPFILIVLPFNDDAKFVAVLPLG